MNLVPRTPLPPLLACALAASLSSAQAAPPARLPPELPIEQLTMATLPQVDTQRIYLSDPAMGHLVDGRTHILDGSTMRYLGMLGTGFAGLTTLSRDRQTIFVATTYHSRLQRGTRTDVLEAYSAKDLSFQYEIELPAKRVQGLAMRALMATSADDRFLMVQNATPATSVSVVNLASRSVSAEITTPGCYGVIPWPTQPSRFSAVCGDGTLASYELDEGGRLASKSVSAPFFDPDRDPVFMHYEFKGTRLSFVSYLGKVHEIDLGSTMATSPEVAKPWTLLDAADLKAGWRPGGYQLFAIDPASGRLYVGMHDKGAEGSHKNPAKEIWVFDSTSRKRIARIPGQAAIAMRIAPATSAGGLSRLFVLSGTDARVLAFDLSPHIFPTKPALRSDPVGETPVYLGM